MLILSGSAIPADCELCESEVVQVDQAQLTGESLPVTMRKGSAAMMGSTCVRGETEAIVTATGTNTFFGRTAALIDSVEDESNLQKVRAVATERPQYNCDNLQKRVERDRDLSR